MPKPHRSNPATRISDHVDAEIWRANRYGRPFSILALHPGPGAGGEATHDELLLATKAVTENVRSIDRVGLFRDVAILSLLPETDAEGALNAAHRVAEHMTVRSHWTAPHVWIYGIAELRDDVEDGDQLIAGALADLRSQMQEATEPI